MLGSPEPIEAFSNLEPPSLDAVGATPYPRRIEFTVIPSIPAWKLIGGALGCQLLVVSFLVFANELHAWPLLIASYWTIWGWVAWVSGYEYLGAGRTWLFYWPAGAFALVLPVGFLFGGQSASMLVANAAGSTIAGMIIGFPMLVVASVINHRARLRRYREHVERLNREQKWLQREGQK